MGMQNDLWMPQRKGRPDADPVREFFPFQVDRTWYDNHWYRPDVEPRQRPLIWAAGATAALAALVVGTFG